MEFGCLVLSSVRRHLTKTRQQPLDYTVYHKSCGIQCSPRVADVFWFAWRLFDDEPENMSIILT